VKGIFTHWDKKKFVFNVEQFVWREKSDIFDAYGSRKRDKERDLNYFRLNMNKDSLIYI